MPSLRELQRGFALATVCNDNAALAGLGIVAGGIDPAARIGIYRNNVFGNYRNALAATFPVIKRLLGAPSFHGAVDAFVRAYPSTGGDLNTYGGEFAAFLGVYPPTIERAYLPDVARLEWAFDQAQRAADAPPLDLQQLAAVPADEIAALRLVLHPATCLVASSFPIFRIWQINQPDRTGEEHVDFTSGVDRLLVARGAGGVSIERLSAGEHALLCAIAAGTPLGTAAERAADEESEFDLGRVLRKHVASQTVVGFRAPARPRQEDSP